MKPSADALIAQRIDALFQRQPVLSGFSVWEDLMVADAVVHTWPGQHVDAALYEDIADAIGGILEESPDAAELLRGRTFARTLQ